MATALHNPLGWHATFPGLRYPVTVSGIPDVTPEGNKGIVLALLKASDADSVTLVNYVYLSGTADAPTENLPVGSLVPGVPFIIPRTLFDAVNPYILPDAPDRTYNFRLFSKLTSGTKLAQSGDFVITPWPHGVQPSAAVAGAHEV